jgi:uncharacterized protein YbjT (DUF2867 family)
MTKGHDMILVTGAAGMNGSAVIREFARQGAPVRALVRRIEKAVEFQKYPTVKTVEGDMLRPETLGAALNGVHRVLMISSADAQLVETQCAFIDACKRAAVGHIVKFSGRESNIGYDQLRFRFTRMHVEVEQYLEASGVAWTHLQPSQFMQVYLREAPTVVSKGALFLPMAEVTMSPVDIADIAKVAFALLQGEGHEGRAYVMTGPEALTMHEIAAHISEAVGRPLRYVPITPEERRQTLLAAGAPPYFADALVEQAYERLRNPKSQVYLGTHETFGVEPTTFPEFARRNAAAFRGAALAFA